MPKEDLMRYSVDANGNMKSKRSEPGTCCSHCGCKFSHQVRNDLLNFSHSTQAWTPERPFFFAADPMMVCCPRPSRRAGQFNVKGGYALDLGLARRRVVCLSRYGFVVDPLHCVGVVVEHQILSTFETSPLPLCTTLAHRLLDVVHACAPADSNGIGRASNRSSNTPSVLSSLTTGPRQESMNAVRPTEFSGQKRSFDGSVIVLRVAQRFPYLLADACFVGTPSPSPVR